MIAPAQFEAQLKLEDILQLPNSKTNRLCTCIIQRIGSAVHAACGKIICAAKSET